MPYSYNWRNCRNKVYHPDERLNFKTGFCPYIYRTEAFIFFMQEKELIPHLYRKEFRKITSVLAKTFGMEHTEVAEDLVSDTFLLAAETWGLKGIPQNPVAWLYTVAKNKAKDLLKRDAIFSQKVSPEIKNNTEEK